MFLNNHKVDGVPFEQARWIGNEITPEIVVLHDTGSRLDEGRAAEYLLDNKAKVSVHFVIERSGKIVQQVPTNRRANHAGKSSYHGREWCNGFSIGIEFVNPGLMTEVTGGENNLARTWYGETFNRDEHGLQNVYTNEHGFGWWMPYTEEQISSAIELLQALFDGIQTLSDIVTHWYISPGRKVDTNPLFPLPQLRSLILGREDLASETADSMSAIQGKERLVQIDVLNGGLNMRSWPSFNNNIMTSIPDGTVVPVVRSGRFDDRDWLKVVYDGKQGWIYAAYAAEVSIREPRRRSAS